MLCLLQNRVWVPAWKQIVSNQKQLQAVDMGKTRSRNHIGGTAAVGAGGDHHLAAQFSLSIINGNQRHGLLIFPSPYGKLVQHPLQSFR